MQEAITRSIFFFFVYSFTGWLFEEIYAAIKYGKFVNRGFINGPLCPQYGIIMLIMLYDLRDLNHQPVIQFIATMVLISIVQYVTGAVLRLVTGRRFWDYSDDKWNIGGHVSVKSVLLWTTILMLIIWLMHPYVYIVYEIMPKGILKIVEAVVIALFFIDLFVTLAVSLKWKLKGDIYENVASSLEKTKLTIGEKVFEHIKRRMYKAFPEMESQTKSDTDGFGVPHNRVFAQGMCFDKLFWVFFICALLGDWIETVFVWATAGQLMSRSSLLYGTFSIVWGLGGAIITGVLYTLKNKNDRYIFIGGFFMGGVYEYSCSVFTEVVFGTKFWDYSHLPFNINCRVNMLFCFFWGVVAIVWIKFLYPKMSKIIEKIPPVTGKLLTWLLIILMSLDIGVSSLALSRYTSRKNGEPAQTSIDQFLDNTYNDQFIEKIYPNMTMAD